MNLRVCKFVITIIVLGCSTLISHRVEAAVHAVTNFAQLQTALTESQSNNQADTINIAGTTIDITSTLMYYPVSTEMFSITINGAGPESTILDGGGRSLAILEMSYSGYLPEDDGVVITLTGLTFQNVSDTDSTALYVYPYKADIVINNCSFLYNSTTNAGAGAYLSNSADITVSNSLFSNNTSVYYSGALYMYPGGAATIDNCEFRNNQITYEGDGAAAYVSSDTAILTNNRFIENILENYYDYGGGAIYVNSTNSVEISNNTFHNNSITEYGYGGAAYIYSYQGEVVVSENEIIGNSNINGDYGGGLYIDAENMVISNNLISGSSTQREGGGMYLNADGTAKIYNNVIVDNTVISESYGDGGGGVYLSGSAGALTYILTNNTITGNNSSRSGGGLYFRASDDNNALALRNNIIWGNSAGDDGNDMYIDVDGDNNGTNSTINLLNNAYQNVIDGGLHIIGATYPLAIYNANIHSDPLFVDEATGDYHLSSASLCKDAGDNTWVDQIMTDFEGDDRILYTTVDIGADEYFSNVLIGDINGDEVVNLADVITVLTILSGGQVSTSIEAGNSIDINSQIGLEDAVYILRDVADI